MKDIKNAGRGLPILVISKCRRNKISFSACNGQKKPAPNFFIVEQND
jgi:hypothetical protein